MKVKYFDKKSLLKQIFKLFCFIFTTAFRLTIDALFRSQSCFFNFLCFLKGAAVWNAVCWDMLHFFTFTFSLLPFFKFRPAAAAAAAGFRKHKKLKKHDCERNKASIVNLNAVVKMKQSNLNID